MPTSTGARLLFLTLAAIIASVLAACSDEGPGEPETIEIPTRWASANARDLRTLVAASDEVFVGRVVRLEGQTDQPVPGAGGVGERQPTTFPVSRFEVRVVRQATGGLGAGTMVIIEQAGGVTTQPDGTEARLILDGDEPLKVGATYLFFATRKPNGSLTAPPFGRLVVGASGRLDPVGPWSSLGAIQELTGLSPDEGAMRAEAAR
jgi:hypothetical protein